MDPGDLGDLGEIPGAEDPGADASGGGSAEGLGDGSPTPTPTPSPTPTPTDPTLELYRQVAPGDCLNNWMISETEWVSDTPDPISCDDEAAGVWVSDTADSVSACPVDAGRSYLSYTSGAETVALCVTRQFEVGQCFLGMADGTANLMSWVDCEGSIVPPYSQLYNVTGVYSAPATVTGDECRQSASDQNTYWWWTTDAESVLVCTVVYSG